MQARPGKDESAVNARRLRRSVGLVLASSSCACLHAPSVSREPLGVVASPAEARVPGQSPSPRSSTRTGFPPSWKPGQALLQGYLGASFLSDLTLSPSGNPPIGLEDGGYEVLPVFGGGAQLKLAGERVDFGVEGFLEFSGRSDLEAFATSGGTTVAAFDVNLLRFQIYGGPFVSLFTGDNLRLYGSAGPLVQWVGYDQDDGDDATDDEDANGAGGGLYARTGIEFQLPSRKLVGFGVRWSEASIDLGGDLGDLDLDGLDLYVTYSYGLEPRSAFERD